MEFVCEFSCAAMCFSLQTPEGKVLEAREDGSVGIWFVEQCWSDAMHFVPSIKLGAAGFHKDSYYILEYLSDYFTV